MTDLFRKYKSLFSTTSNSFATGSSVDITLNSATGLPTDTDITLTFDRVDSAGAATSGLVERIIGRVSGVTFQVKQRGADGTTERAHTSPVVEQIWNAEDINDMIDGILLNFDQTGAYKNISASTISTTVSTVATSSLNIGSSTVIRGAIDDDTMATASASTVATSESVKAYVDANAGGFWKAVPGTPTRVSDTQFTITDTSNANLYDQLFKKGVVLRWLESSTFQTAMVISSSYGTNTVTINIVGDSLTAGFTTMKYAIEEIKRESFIIPGTIATGTDLAKTWYTPEQCYIISADAFVKTAGTTNSTVFDINDDGTTKFTTKPTITTGTTSDIDNVADNPSTAVTKDSLITIDVDSVSTTAPVEAYIYLYWYPISWRYRT